MSIELFIPLKVVLTNPHHFRLDLDYNVGIEDAVEEIQSEQTDWYQVIDCLKPVHRCRFGANRSWFTVSFCANSHLYTDGPTTLCSKEYSVCLITSKSNATWISKWLDENNYSYFIL